MQSNIHSSINVEHAKVLSPKRNTSVAETTEALVSEQLSH